MTTKLMTVTASALACGLSLVALTHAQTAPVSKPNGEEPLKLEAFTVTGSNIRRVDAETALPVTVKKPEFFPVDVERKLIKNNFAWAAKEQPRIIAEWRKRYESKAQPR